MSNVNEATAGTPHSRKMTSRLRLPFLLTAALLALTVGVVGSAVAVEQARTLAASEARIEAETAQQVAQLRRQAEINHARRVIEAVAAAQRAALSAQKASSAEEIRSARAVLTSSEGKVMDEKVRTALSSLINAADESLIGLDYRLMAERSQALAPAVEAVNSSIKAWQEEQDRLTAEAAARAKRAAASASAAASKSSPPSGIQKLRTGCVKGPAASGAETQAIIDKGCTAYLTYGPSPWLAAHNYNAGDSWKAMADGEKFTYNGHIYQITGRNDIRYSGGEVALGPLVYGDLTLQTCISHGHIVFIHANIVG